MYRLCKQIVINYRGVNKVSITPPPFSGRAKTRKEIYSETTSSDARCCAGGDADVSAGYGAEHSGRG